MTTLLAMATPMSVVWFACWAALIFVWGKTRPRGGDR